jgi:hypothetical protein
VHKIAVPTPVQIVHGLFDFFPYRHPQPMIGPSLQDIILKYQSQYCGFRIAASFTLEDDKARDDLQLLPKKDSHHLSLKNPQRGLRQHRAAWCIRETSIGGQTAHYRQLR